MNIHKSGVSVTSIVSCKHPEAHVVDYFQQEKNNKGIANVLSDVILRPIMPMLIQASPIYTILTHDRKRPWKSRVTNSYILIYEMTVMIKIYTTVTALPFYQENAELCKSVLSMLNDRAPKLEQSFLNKVARLNDGNIKAFEMLVKKYTFAYINLLELALFKLFVEGEADLEFDKDCMSKQTDLSEVPIHNSVRTMFEKHSALFFSTKEKLANAAFKANFHFDLKKDIYGQYLQFFKRFHDPETTKK
jgi:hypothetical protein